MTTAPVDISGIEQYLTVLALHNATDLHLTAGAPPLLRIDGQLTPDRRAPARRGRAWSSSCSA